MEYRYRATLEPDEEGRVLVRFPDLPEALTDGADVAEALAEAVDCLSEALASRMVDGEPIPPPTAPASAPLGGAPDQQQIISPALTIALKAALYTALRRRDMTVADLAARLDVDWHQAARLIDPHRASKLTSLSAALGALGCEIRLSVYDPDEIDAGLVCAWRASCQPYGEAEGRRGEDARTLGRGAERRLDNQSFAVGSREVRDCGRRRRAGRQGDGLGLGRPAAAVGHSPHGRFLHRHPPAQREARHAVWRRRRQAGDGAHLCAAINDLADWRTLDPEKIGDDAGLAQQLHRIASVLTGDATGQRFH
jgi:antitoxin HicB